MTTSRLLLLAGALATGCGFEPPAALPEGQWSAPEANLYVGRGGSTLELICRSSSLPGDIPLDAGGRFMMQVTVMEIGITVTQHMATITGRLEDGTLLLTVTPAPPGAAPETHRLHRRAAPPLPRCG